MDWISCALAQVLRHILMHNRRLSARKLNKISTSFNTHDMHTTLGGKQGAKATERRVRAVREEWKWIPCSSIDTQLMWSACCVFCVCV